MVAGVLNLIFPRACVICGAPDIDLCDFCISKITTDWRRVDGQAIYLTVPIENSFAASFSGENGEQLKQIFPIYTPNRYTGIIKDLIVRWKHSNLKSFENVMSGIWCAQIFSLLSLLSVGNISFQMLFPALQENCEVVLVNAPSGFRRRFDDQLIAWKLTQILAKCVKLKPIEALRKEFQLRKIFQKLVQKIFSDSYQVADFSARHQKTTGVRAVVDLSGKSVILVDDVLTTGATLLGSARAVANAGGMVVGAICFANAMQGTDL